MPKLTEEQAREYATIGRMIWWVGLTLIGSFFAMTGPLPWPAVGLVAVIGGIVLSVKTRRRAKKLPAAHGVLSTLTAALVLSAFLLLYGTGAMIQWPAQWRYQQCTAQALTQQGHEECIATYKKESQAIIERFLVNRPGS